MIQCRDCINWVDESLVQIEADPNGTTHLFMGCRVYGNLEETERQECLHYIQSENLFTVCNSCRLPVPKVCVSLGECINCTDTDLFCVDHCKGGDQRKYCTHFVRLYSEGTPLLHEDRVFDLFPSIGMPTGKNPKTKN